MLSGSKLTFFLEHSTTAEETIRGTHTYMQTGKNWKISHSIKDLFYLPASSCYFCHCCFDLFSCEKAEVIRLGGKEEVGNGDAGIPNVGIGNR